MRFDQLTEKNIDPIPVDYHPVLQEALELADKGFYGAMIETPDGKRMPVRLLLNKYGMHKMPIDSSKKAYRAMRY